MPVRRHLDGILRPELELHEAVLPGLEAGGFAERRPEAQVVGRGHGGEHGPGLDQLLLDPVDPGGALEGGLELVGPDMGERRVELPVQELQPELHHLMDGDEEKLVVLGREGGLGGEEGVEPEIIPIAHALGKIGMNPVCRCRQVSLPDLVSASVRIIVLALGAFDESRTLRRACHAG